MKFTKILLAAVLMMAATVAMAQENGNRDAEGKIVRGPYETNKFFDNWFVGVGVGANMYQGEYDWKGDFFPRVSFALDVNLGKWVTPVLGLRAQYSGIQSKGWTTANNVFARAKDGEYNKQKFGYHFVHADAMVNISNLFSGYKETRRWDFIPYIGFGVARAHKTGYTNHKPAGVIGLINEIYISNRVDITLEGKQMIVGQGFDGETGGSKLEGMTSATVGVSVKLGKTNFKRVEKVAPADYTPYNNRIAELEQQNAQLANANKALNDEVEALRNRPVVKDIPNAPVALFFPIGKATLDSKELVNLDYYVKTAIAGSENKTFTIIGSADSATGTKEYNQKLSEKRAQYVADLLINKYGISADRLTIKAVGASDNQFKEARLNRTVLMVE